MRGKKPTYTIHARERMVQRRISESEVEETLVDPYAHYSDVDGNDIFIGRPGGRRIKVVVKKGSNPPLVITTAD